MANRPVPDTIGLEVRGTLLDQDVENTFYYKYISPPDESELLTLVNDIGDYWEENMLELLPIGWTGREVYARDLSAPIAVQATNPSIAGLDGTAAGATLPSYVTLAVARRSGLTGRSARGRVFWMGFSENFVTANQVDSGTANAIVAAVEAMDDVAVALGLTPVIVSRYQAGVQLTTPLTYNISQWLVTDLNVDTRRSRKPGSGS